jgi:hypothetical protein
MNSPSQFDWLRRRSPQLENAHCSFIRIRNYDLCFSAPCRLGFVYQRARKETVFIAVLTSVAGMFFIRVMISVVFRAVIIVV